MPEEPKNKLLIFIISIVVFVLFVIVILSNNLANVFNNNSSLSNELNKAYNISEIAVNQSTQQDKESLIQKLNTNQNIIVNESICEDLPEDFSLCEDITLTNKEFCQLLNIFIKQKNKSSENIVFVQCDINQNLSSTIQRTFITTYLLIDTSTLNNMINVSSNNSLLVVNKYVKNNNNITNTSLSKTISINGITYADASSALQGMFFEEMFADVFDGLVYEIEDIFNCHIEYSENSVIIYA